MLKSSICTPLPGVDSHINCCKLVFSSIGVSFEDLTVVSCKINLLLREFVLIRAEHLCNRIIVDSTHYSSAISRLGLSTLFDCLKTGTWSNWSYIELRRSRNTNRSLLKYKRRWGGRAEEVSSGGHFRIFRG